MTVALTNTRELDINTLLKRSAQLAGLLALEQSATGTQWEQRAAFGRDQLDLILDRMPTQGIIVRDVELYTLTLSADFGGEADPIALPSDTVDVVGVAMYRETSTSTEQRVEPVDREYWQASGDKDTTAPPTRYYLNRAGTVELYLLPVPETANATLRLQRKKLLADSNDGSKTVDLERYWLDYLQFELAWRFSLSTSMPAANRGELRAQANECKAAALAAAKQTLPSHMELDHGTEWS